MLRKIWLRNSVVAFGLGRKGYFVRVNKILRRLYHPGSVPDVLHLCNALSTFILTSSKAFYPVI